MGANKQVMCDKCHKYMRSDNVKRHRTKCGISLHSNQFTGIKKRRPTAVVIPACNVIEVSNTMAQVRPPSTVTTARMVNIPIAEVTTEKEPTIMTPTSGRTLLNLGRKEEVKNQVEQVIQANEDPSENLLPIRQLVDVIQAEAHRQAYPRRILFPWQQELVDILEGQSDREVYILCDERGNNGKTELTRQLRREHNKYHGGILDNSATKILWRMKNNRDRQVLFLDVPRGMELPTFYRRMEIVESIKNGFVKSGRSEPGELLANPIIVILCNYNPRSLYEALKSDNNPYITSDRPRIFKIRGFKEEGHLQEYKYSRTITCVTPGTGEVPWIPPEVTSEQVTTLPPSRGRKFMTFKTRDNSE